MIEARASQSKCVTEKHGPWRGKEEMAFALVGCGKRNFFPWLLEGMICSMHHTKGRNYNKHFINEGLFICLRREGHLFLLFVQGTSFMIMAKK